MNMSQSNTREKRVGPEKVMMVRVPTEPEFITSTILKRGYQRSLIGQCSQPVGQDPFEGPTGVT